MDRCFETIIHSTRDFLVGKRFLGEELYYLYEPCDQAPTDSRLSHTTRRMQHLTSMRHADCENRGTRVVFYTTTVVHEEQHDVIHETLTFRNLITRDSFVATSVYTQPHGSSVTTLPWVEFSVESAGGRYTGATSVIAAYNNLPGHPRTLSVYRMW